MFNRVLLFHLLVVGSCPIGFAKTPQEYDRLANKYQWNLSQEIWDVLKTGLIPPNRVQVEEAYGFRVHAVEVFHNDELLMGMSFFRNSKVIHLPRGPHAPFVLASAIERIYSIDASRVMRPLKMLTDKKIPIVIFETDGGNLAIVAYHLDPQRYPVQSFIFNDSPKRSEERTRRVPIQVVRLIFTPGNESPQSLTIEMDSTFGYYGQNSVVISTRQIGTLNSVFLQRKSNLHVRGERLTEDSFFSSPQNIEQVAEIIMAYRNERENLFFSVGSDAKGYDDRGFLEGILHPTVSSCIEVLEGFDQRGF